MARTKETARKNFGGKAPSKKEKPVVDDSESEAEVVVDKKVKTAAKAAKAKAAATKPAAKAAKDKAAKAKEAKPAKAAKKEKKPVVVPESESDSSSSEEVVVAPPKKDKKKAAPVVVPEPESDSESSSEETDDDAEEEDSESSSSSEEEVVVVPPKKEKKAAPKAKAAAKPAAKAKATKPVAPAKVESDSESDSSSSEEEAVVVPPKKEKKEVLTVPDVSYLVKAQDLISLIETSLESTKGQVQFFNAVIKGLEKNIQDTPPRSTPGTVDIALMAMKFDSKLSAFVDRESKYAGDPLTNKLFGKVKDGKVVPFENGGMVPKLPIWKDSDGDYAGKSEIKTLLESSAKYYKDALAQKAKPAPTASSDKGKTAAKKQWGDESSSEGEDDGKVVEGTRKVTDPVSRVEKDKADIMDPTIKVNEEILAKFLAAQNSEGVSKTDYKAIASKSGLPVETTEYIISHFALYKDQYPQVFARFVMKTSGQGAAARQFKSVLKR